MNRFLFILICVVSHIRAVAAPVGFMPVVSNYTQSSYPGGLQNWSVSQSASGLMWFGNQNCLMSFDGNRWESWQLPSRAVVRAVLADGDRVYVGSYTDFGYFSRDSIGGYVYHSLWPAGYKAHNDEIWRIIKAGDGHVWFQSFCSWFDYDGKNKVTAHYDRNMLPLHFFPVGREVYAQMINGGLYRIKGTRYVAVASRKDYGDDDIVAMSGMRGGALLCVTSRNGLYVVRGNRMTPLATEADPFLRGSQVNNAAMLGRSILVAGTILNGIYAINLDTGRLLWHYNMSNSLNNNTVLGLTTDRGGNVWAALDNGIGRYRMDAGWRRPPVFPLTVARVTTVSRQNRTEYVGCAADGDNRIYEDNISVVLSYPDYDGRLLTYRYRLKGNGHEMRRQQESPVLSFNSLGYGDYVLDAEVLSPDGEVLARAAYGFSRPVPWWLSVWALAAYAVLFLVAFRRYVNWRTDRIVSRNRHAAEEELMRQNLKMMEQKQLIAAQQRIIMENELTVKSKELANMAFRMEVMRSHSEQMRDGLMEKKRKGKLTDKDFRELITKAEENDKEEMWELFRHNFDLIHQNFFRNLRARYPELTPLDLKFCAMLRLNMNTKEIARHTNLTIRGVEGARYRLRKKLGIGKDQSLTEFLIDLK